MSTINTAAFISSAASAYNITGMTCGSCVSHVQQALAPLGAVMVALSAPQAVFTKPIENEKVQAALHGTRYQVQPHVDDVSRPAPTPISTPVAGKNASMQQWFASYKPLLILVGLVAGCSAVLSWQIYGEWNSHEWMRFYMAGFFIAFAYFKLLNLTAFADAYAGYDLLAARWYGWGKVYPFVELGLGLAYLANWQPLATNWVAFIVMGFSALGVLRAVLGKQSIRCACMGTVFQLPMSTVTVIETLGMAVMAGWMVLA